MNIPPRFPIDRARIEAVVARFYGEVRRDAILGPVFAAHVADWPPHEAKIGRFWSNVILYERSYDGNPMQVHRAAGNVRPEHFGRWLALFDEVLEEVLPGDVARAWSALAHRIGRGLRMGVEADMVAQGGVPDLRV